MTILNESGTPDLISPLHILPYVAERFPDTLFIVAGTRADAHLAQSLSIPLPGTPATRLGQSTIRHPQVVFVLLEPDEEPDSGSLASRIIETVAGFRRVELVLLIARRSASLLGVDAGFEATLAERRLELPVRTVVPPDPHTGNVLSTDLEDGLVRALLELCPEPSPEPREDKPRSKGDLLGRFPFRTRSGRRTNWERGSRRPVVLLGAHPGSQKELAAELGRVGVEVTGSVPSTESVGLPPIGEETIVALADPYLSRACRTAEERGAKVTRSLLPIGVDGTARFVQDVAASSGRGTSEAERARSVWKGLEHLRSRIRGRRIFFTGDTGLEVPLARFMVNAGAVVVEVGTPRLEKRSLAAELAALGEDVDVVESPDWWAQLDRIDAARPDLVVSSPGLYVPLVSRGHLCRSSLDLLSLGVHGYEGARRILELFARTFERAERLDALDL